LNTYLESNRRKRNTDDEAFVGGVDVEEIITNLDELKKRVEDYEFNIDELEAILSDLEKINEKIKPHKNACPELDQIVEKLKEIIELIIFNLE
jgi:DNA repair exonuclease SbcCD ATPase subunit